MHNLGGGAGFSIFLQQVQYGSLSLNQCKTSYGDDLVSNDKICPIGERNKGTCSVSYFIFIGVDLFNYISELNLLFIDFPYLF